MPSRESQCLVSKIVLILMVASASLGYDPIFSDNCLIAKTGQIGQCVLAIECPALIPTLALREHTVCGYNGLFEIVCCPLPDYGLQATSTERLSATRLSTDTISVQKCDEYRKQIPIPDAGAFGGVETIPSEYPHMALIGYRNGKNETSWMCGGSLISEQFVLTAAHCIVTKHSHRPDLVKLGVHSINNPNDLPVDHSVEYTVAESIRHPQYRARSFYNDIGLLRLTTLVKIFEFVRPACLPAERIGDEQQGTIVVATGWGNTAYKGMASDRLVKVELELYNHAECSQAYQDVARGTRLRDGIDSGTQMCAGSHTEAKDTCEADSGGPLQTKSHKWSYFNQYTIVGITSFGKPCGFVNSPGVYTRVYAYLEWIENVVWPHKIKNTSKLY